MSLTRKCGACGAMIEKKNCLEVGLRVLKTDGAEEQDPIEQAYDDYCDGCVLDGCAVTDLLQSLTKYKARKA